MSGALLVVAIFAVWGLGDMLLDARQKPESRFRRDR